MNRAQREKEPYNTGDVYKHSYKLQNRFKHVFLCPNSLKLEKYFEDSVTANIKDSIVLDYGCLYGDNCAYLHKLSPKKLIGIDITEKGIAKAKQNYGEIAEFCVMDAQQMTFQSNTFDLIVGRSILHHLDWMLALGEINRVLRIGGTAIFMEPIGDNPVAKVIRKITSKARTLDEKPITRAQIQLGNQIFGNSQHAYANLVSVPFAMISSLISKNPDNLILKTSDKIDQFLSKTFLRYWMRQVVLVWKKTK